MKKIVLFILLAGFLTTGFAQKKNYAVKVSKENATFIAKQMSLNKDKTKFIEGVLLEKYQGVSKELKNNPTISQEEKKAIYKKSYKKLLTDLSQEFSKKDINRINKLLKEQNNKRKKS